MNKQGQDRGTGEDKFLDWFCNIPDDEEERRRKRKDRTMAAEKNREKRRDKRKAEDFQPEDDQREQS